MLTQFDIKGRQVLNVTYDSFSQAAREVLLHQRPDERLIEINERKVNNTADLIDSPFPLTIHG